MLELVSYHTSKIHLQSLGCVCVILMIYSKKPPFIERDNTFIKLTHLFQILCMHAQIQTFSQVNRSLWRIQRRSKLAQFSGLEDHFFHLQLFAIMFSSGVICYNTIEVTSDSHITSGLVTSNITSNREFHVPGTLETPVQKMVSTLRKVHIAYGSGNFPKQFYP